MKAIIGGTGVYSASGKSKKQIVETEYGDVELDIINVNGEDIVFLARHGKSHSTPPHLINYRANMMALKQLGVNYIYATAAVGSCNEKYAPGDVVIIKDFLDFTKSRVDTFFEGGKERVKHVDMTEPYCHNMGHKFRDKAGQLGLEIQGPAVYVCTEGPRFETASEIKMFQKLGGDVVGMTSVPEVVLAKELGMCYSSIGIITNWCTGIKGEFTLHDIQGSVDKNRDKITEIFIAVFQEGLDQLSCKCNDSLIQL